jgi:PBP1b-binding outer membrane lipoprotein LpoB
MKKIVALASAAAFALTLAACDGANENAMEDAGEQNAELVDDQADAMEDAGVINDTQEDAMVDSAENQADAMEEQGEAMDNGAMAPTTAATTAAPM